MIRVGSFVRYAPAYRSPGEEKYIHIVREERLNPVTGGKRWLIETINTNLFLNPTETVNECMIEEIENQEV